MAEKVDSRIKQKNNLDREGKPLVGFGTSLFVAHGRMMVCLRQGCLTLCIKS